MPDGDRIADDLITGIGPVTAEVYGEDTPEKRRRVYRQMYEVDPDERLKGIFRVGGKISCLRSVLRADLQRRAEEGAVRKPRTPIQDLSPVRAFSATRPRRRRRPPPPG